MKGARDEHATLAVKGFKLILFYKNILARIIHSGLVIPLILQNYNYNSS